MAIRHVVFDIGNVLLNFDPELAYLDQIPDQVERHAFLRDVCSRAWITAQDRVHAWAPGEAELIARYPDREALIRSFRERWHDMVPNAIADSVGILEQLSGTGLDVTALTNFNGETFDEAVQRFDFLKLFRGITVSGRVGMLKPEADIFRHHVTAFGLVPEATLFIDDVAANVEAAQNAGWHSVQFSNPDRLRHDLRSHDVIV
ncbi:HAD-IA family hydrolase [Anderseniella sp. Alg231-50]|uniref:HAD-IA family hydrolase n=1 Tax=Anderseniella sp. Alg231-50 TaxID=1922226 RepID=UPI000D561E41